MGAILCRIQIDGSHPPVDDPRVLSSRQVRRFVFSAGEQVIVLSQAGLCDPGRHSRSGGFGDFELDVALRLALEDYCPVQKTLSVGDITDAQGHQIAATQLAVDGEIKQAKVTDLGRQLQTNPDGPDFLQLERTFLADDLALVPGCGGGIG